MFFCSYYYTRNTPRRFFFVTDVCIYLYFFFFLTKTTIFKTKVENNGNHSVGLIVREYSIRAIIKSGSGTRSIIINNYIF